MWVLFGILIFVLLLMLIPIRFSVEYSAAGFSAVLKVLFFKVKIPSDKKEETQKQKNEKRDKEKKPGNLKNLTALITPALDALGRLVRMLCIRKLVMNIKIASKDAFSTAMLYGGAAAGIGTFFPILDRNLKVKKKFISVNADFEEDEISAYLFADISILVWQILVIAICFLYKYLKKILAIKKKGNEENG